MLAVDLNNTPAPEKMPERIIKNGLLRTEGVHEAETMQVEDLAALDILTEDNLISELYTKLAKGSFTSFIGDILLILNPNMHADIYGENVSVIIAQTNKNTFNERDYLFSVS